MHMRKEKYQYDKIKEKYLNFKHPMTKVIIEGKDIAESAKDLVLSDLEADLSTGFEASVVNFSLYHVFDQEEGQYRFADCRQYITLGSSISVEMGYSGQFTEIFTGFIAAVRFVKSGTETHHIEVTAMDVKGIMMSGSFSRQLSSNCYSKAVEEILEGSLYQKLQSKNIYKTAKITPTPDVNMQNRPLNSTIEMVAESDYEFIVKTAKRFNYEFFVENGTICFRRRKDIPQDELLMQLKNADGILSYDMTFDMTGLVKKVEVRGADTARGTVVTATAKASNKISKGSKAKALINETSKVVLDANATTKEAAQYRADSLMEDIAYRFGSLTCDCVGIPELMPGYFIRISDLGDPCDAKFYVTHTRHVMNDYDGYHTYITAKAAMLSD